MATRVLVVDDDQQLRELLAEYLQRNGFLVRGAADGVGMRATMAQWQPHLIILDLMLPGESGLDLCRDLRRNSELPVIMLTALGEDADRIVGLELGADDYLPKPFNPRELLARIRSVLRRARPSCALPSGGRWHFAGWTLDEQRCQLCNPAGVSVPIGAAELRLLLAFVQRPGRVLSRDFLVDYCFGRDAEPFDRSIDMQISRLRRKLGDRARQPTIIRTVRSAGYMLAAPVSREP
jgi:two-component system OmpR family response regulator